MYEYTDKVIKKLNTSYLRLFTRLKLLSFDELNIITSVKEIYQKCLKMAKKRYLEIAEYYFYMAYELAAGKEKKKPSDDWINNDWLLDMLEEYDPVTLYRFIPEFERKQQRLIEALIASHKKNTEVDKALRFWALQSNQYADKVTDEATLRGYKAAGIKKVRWITEKDNRVCPVCRKLNMRVFDIDKIPDKPHYRCRCYLLPVKEKK